jgi:hypothetical protein
MARRRPGQVMLKWKHAFGARGLAPTREESGSWVQPRMARSRSPGSGAPDHPASCSVAALRAIPCCPLARAATAFRRLDAAEPLGKLIAQVRRKWAVVRKNSATFMSSATVNGRSNRWVARRRNCCAASNRAARQGFSPELVGVQNYRRQSSTNRLNGRSTVDSVEQAPT